MSNPKRLHGYTWLKNGFYGQQSSIERKKLDKTKKPDFDEIFKYNGKLNLDASGKQWVLTCQLIA